MLVLIFYATILALLGISFGYFLAPVPIIVIAIICTCCLAFLYYKAKSSKATSNEGGLALIFIFMAILIFLISMVTMAGGIYLSSYWQTIKDSAAPATQFDWSWLFRQR